MFDHEGNTKLSFSKGEISVSSSVENIGGLGEYNLNLYEYVFSNPLKFIDSSGNLGGLSYLRAKKEAMENAAWLTFHTVGRRKAILRLVKRKLKKKSAEFISTSSTARRTDVAEDCLTGFVSSAVGYEDGLGPELGRDAFVGNLCAAIASFLSFGVGAGA